jgi:hypothetical protein
MEALEGLPGVALVCVAIVRSLVDNARSVESLSDAIAVFEEIDGYMKGLHKAADAAHIEIEERNANANRT